MTAGGAAAALTDVLEEARSLGFLGPGPVAPHEEHAAAFLPLLDVDRTAVGPFLDLGTGGGIPGLVLATLLPSSRWVLLDSMVRRTRFLDAAVHRLALRDRVSVVTARAEVLGRDRGHRGRYAAIVARSFAAPPVLAECAAPLVRTTGTVVVSEPPATPGADRPSTERWPPAELAQLGLTVDRFEPGPPALVRLRAVHRCAARFPRATGVPAKQPLW